MISRESDVQLSRLYYMPREKPLGNMENYRNLEEGNTAKRRRNGLRKFFKNDKKTDVMSAAYVL